MDQPEFHRGKEYSIHSSFSYRRGVASEANLGISGGLGPRNRLRETRRILLRWMKSSSIARRWGDEGTP